MSKEGGNAADNKATPTIEASQKLFSDDFFTNLDKQVMGSVLDNGNDQSLAAPGDIFGGNLTGDKVRSGEVNQSAEELAIELAETKTRYASSSEEGRRLNDLVKELEPFFPLIKTMKTDPQLVTHVKSYFADGGKAPSSLKEQLNLPADFEYSEADAISDPESDSAKLQKATINQIVTSSLKEGMKTQQDSDKRKQIVEQRKVDEIAFLEAHPDMKDTGKWTEFNKYIDNRVLTLEDIWLLRNKDERDAVISQNATDKTIKKMSDTQLMPGSLANAQGQRTTEMNPVEGIMKHLIGLDRAENVLIQSE